VLNDIGTGLSLKLQWPEKLSLNAERKNQMVADQESLAITPESAAAAASFQT
jgi:hypothetical protein